MISTIILCKRPNFEKSPTPANFLCSAIVIFKEELPITHGYCEIFKNNEDIYIHSKGWSIPQESLIRTIQMYVRNKLNDIEAGNISTADKARTKAERYLIKQGRSFATDLDMDNLPKEIQECVEDYPPEMKAEILSLDQEIQNITDRVNAAWKK
ncbi:hypothetical protein [Bacillus massiliigorillae]|uniref:hypothetical protein n=1 Tax=Bacillus massiliigorillae TaxID=1243664 RepID=UPI00039CE916|nr:hypothetical protein [Bacillus massiliigorillae]